MPALGWTPRDFWSASLAEFLAAAEGYQQMHGGGAGQSGFTDEDRAEVERLKRKYS